MAEDTAAAKESSAPDHPPGWHSNPDGPGLRYWNGARWTESYHPGHPDPTDAPTRKEMMWALSLGFGAVGGVVGFLSIPIAAFYFPLGFGTAGAALAIVALTVKGDTPWYAAFALIATLSALGLGIAAYSDFEDTQERLNDAQNSLDDILR